MYDRRSMLQGGAVILSGGIAGCFTGSRSPLGRVAWISITNDSDERHEVRVTVNEDDVTEFFRTYRLGTTQENSTAYIEDPVSEAGRYDVQATTTNQIASVSIPKWIDGDERCVGVNFLITTGGTLRWESKSMQEC